MAGALSKSEVRAVYCKMAAVYDVWGILTESKARRRCLELAAIENGESVLEVAVGTGLLFRQIVEANPAGRNEGLDLTEQMLARARARAEKTGIGSFVLRVGDAYQLPYPNSSFDVLMNNYMFDLLPEPDFSRVVGEFRRVLRGGGRLVVANMTSGRCWFNGLWGWLYRRNPRLVGGCRGVELGPYLKAAGFMDIRTEYISQLTFPSEVIRAVKPELGVPRVSP